MSFEFDFTPAKLAECIHKNKNPQMWYEAFAEHFPAFEITTPARVAGFIAQCQHESLDFTVLQENLNYGAKGLRGLFGKYFPTDALAAQYERKPEMIANRIYASRMSNGNEQSGDGWKFRGRGILQITGRANYTQCSRDLFGDDSLVEDPDLLRQPAYATLSACWFWHKNQLNHICDTGDIVLLSKKINGGTIGLEDRVAHWNAALDLFEGE
jgi:putative chitinase